MTVRENVKQAIKRLASSEKSYRAFADKVGASKQQVNNWINGVNAPDIEMIAQIANAYALPLSEVLYNSFDDPQNRIYGGWVEVPLYGAIAAGKPIEMESVEDKFVIPFEMKRKYPDAFLLKVEGESMNKRLPNGSYALVNPTSDVIDGNAYAVCVNGYDATIKRVRKLENGFELMPDSTDPTIKSVIYDYGEEGTETVTVIGEVVWYCVPFDYSI